MSAIVDKTGRMFGRLKVIESLGLRPYGQKGHRQSAWLCKCECGNTTEVMTCNLGHTTNSCGCLANEQAGQRCRGLIASGSPRLRHGCSRVGNTTPEYAAYCSAKSRCINIDDLDYGGRGILFLFNSFEEWFAELGIKPAPKASYSVDRINNDGPYAVGNVRWATRSQQNKNRRDWR
jgi:hypothetical protein